MLHLREPGPAVLAALGMIEDIEGSGLPPAHAGIDAGSVVFQAGISGPLRLHPARRRA